MLQTSPYPSSDLTTKDHNNTSAWMNNIADRMLFTASWDDHKILMVQLYRRMLV
jgi:hypothetical protein